jgi:hypothetical protein
MPKNRIIIVLGMHRSGTSALTRGLKTLSVELGDHLMAPVEGNNETGFWEDLDIYRLNERLLAKADNAWDRLSPLDDDAMLLDAFAPERVEARNLLDKKLSGTSVFGFKDPRTAVLLPFWKCVLDDMEADSRFILALRNPLEVAESLRKRDHIDQRFGLILWLKYNWAALKHTADRQRLVTSYRNLLASPKSELDRIATAFELPKPTASNPAVKEYLEEFLNPEFQHNRIPDAELSRLRNAPAVVTDLYEQMRTWAEEAPDSSFKSSSSLSSNIESFLHAGRSLMQLSDTYRADAVKQAAKVAILEKDKDELTKAQEQAKAAAAEKDASVRQLTEEYDRSTAKLEQLSDLLEKEKNASQSLTEQLASAEAGQEDARQHQAELEAQISAKNQELEALQAAMLLADKQAANLQIELSSTADELSRVQSDYEQLQSDAEARSAKHGIDLHTRQSEISRLREAGEASDRAAERAKAEIERLKSALAQSETKARELDAKAQEQAKAAAAEKDASVRQLTEEYDRSTAKLEQLSDLLEKEKNASQSLTEQLASAEAGQEDARQHQAELEAQISAKNQELEALQAAMLLADKQAANLQIELSSTADELSRVQSDYEQLQSDAEARSAKHGIDLHTRQSEISRLREAGEASDRAAERAKAEIERLKSALAQSETKARELDAKAREFDARAQGLDAKARELNERVTKGGIALRDAEEKHSRQESVRGQLAQDLKNRTAELRLLRHEVLKLRTSTSWRLTKPVRFLARLLTSFRRILTVSLGKIRRS